MHFYLLAKEDEIMVLRRNNKGMWEIMEGGKAEK